MERLNGIGVSPGVAVGRAVILTLPETAYLKGWTFQAVGGF